MAKMLVIYKTPKDPAAFDKYYFDVHVPLAKTLPGLLSYEVSRGRITGRLTGEAPYMVATLSFSSLDDIKTAFASDAGQACAADVRRFAPGDEDSSIMMFDDEAV